MGSMSWSFAIVNGKLAEVFFDRKKNGSPVILGFCYVKKSEYKTKREHKMIAVDTKKYHITYRKKKYFDQINSRPIASGSFRRR